MDQYVIEGGVPLHGTVRASGNKNAALKIISACLLTEEPVILHNVPDIQDVRIMLQIVAALGVAVDHLGGHSWRIEAHHIETTVLPVELASQIRASFVLSGPLVARMGTITLPLPGGDRIGGRPLDTHVRGLEALGVTANFEKNGLFHLQADQLHGAGYLLQPEQSVTATENTIMAAVLADGETIIDNAACEPHVQDLCHMLIAMGAEIEGVGTNRLIIQGVTSLTGTEFRIGADFMEVGSFIGAAAVTGGSIRIEEADPHQLKMIRLVYERFGVRWEVDGNDIVVPAEQEMSISKTLAGRLPEIKPMPWPGFPPDLMSILVILGTQAAGSVLLHDWMYESRFFFTDKLLFMGANIVLCDPHRVLIQGKSRLFANPAGVTSPDIRAGMAMVLAALCAEGETVIANIHQIDRGYEAIDTKLVGLGAKIRRLSSGNG